MNIQTDFQRLAVHVDALLDHEAITLADAGCILAKFIQEQIGCSRVTLWLLDHAGGTRAMHRFAGHDAITGERLTQAWLLSDTESASYFDALMTEGDFVSDDCVADERLAAIRYSYLIPNDIRATMDTTIAFNGESRAVICCEQQGAPRVWSRQELTLLKRCAAEISLRRAKRHYRDGEASRIVTALVRKITTPRRG